MKLFKLITAAAAAVVSITLSCTASAYHTTMEYAGHDIDVINMGALYGTTLYNSSNGLPTSEANALVQTSNGFVWIGSYSGLIRYDGNNFYRYDSSNGVPSVVSLYEDSKERLWIGTNDKGIVCYENGEFKPYGIIDGLKSASICAVTEDDDGRILIATKVGAAYIDTDGTMRILSEPRLDTEDIRDLDHDDSGIIYGQTKAGAFFTMEGLGVTSFYSGPALGLGTVSCICPDKDKKGFVYLGTDKSEIIHADIAGGMKDYTITDISPLVNVNAIEYVGGTLWICADNGIGTLSSDGRFSIMEDEPMTNSIDDVMCDYEGNMWFASSRQGVMKISESAFIDINRAAEIGDMVVNTTCLYEGDLYIGTDTGLRILDAVTYAEKTNEISGALSNARVRCIKTDSKGNIWFSTYSGLICGKGGKIVKVFDEHSGFVSSHVRVTEELSDGRIAASVLGGIYFIKDGAIESSVLSGSGLSNTEILSICECDDGRILLGGNGGGMYVLDGGNITRIPQSVTDDPTEGLRSDVVMRIKKDPYTGLYWIIGSSSIGYMNGDVIRTVSNFPYSNNFDIFFGDDGSVWILSSNGIYVTTSEELVRNENIEYLFYDANCGLTSVATANSRSCMTEKGDIYIAGSEGVSLMNIHSLKSDNKDIRLCVPFIDIDGRTMSVRNNSSVTVPSTAKRITIYGYALTYSLKNPRLSYQLVGFDSAPVTALRRDMEPVSYTNLKGGIYSFNLSLLDPLTGEVGKTVSVTLIKDQALYEQIWFQIVVIFGALILFILIIELIHRKREAALIKEQQRKQILIDEMTQAFAKCVDMKDNYTKGHSFRVAEYSMLIAAECGKTPAEAKEVYNVALLHDIGKISIPDSVLNKPGRPTDEEYEILKTHAAKGYEVLREITIAPQLGYGAGYHHERLDGKGYPNGLKGDEIPEVAQIIAVADTFDAMYSTRPYRKQMPVEDVLAELKRVSGTQLNEKFVDCLAALVEEGKIGQRKL